MNSDNFEFTSRLMPLQVLEDNIYEQRAQRRLEAESRADPAILHAAGPQAVEAERLPSSSKEISDEGGLASESAAEPMETGQGSALQSKVPSSSADKGTGIRFSYLFHECSLVSHVVLRWPKLTTSSIWKPPANCL